MEKLCTNDSYRFLCSFYRFCWNSPLSEAALLAGAPQKVREEYEREFDGGMLKVGLQEEQQPVTTQDIHHGRLPSSEGREHDGVIQSTVTANTAKYWDTLGREYILIHNNALRVEGFK